MRYKFTLSVTVHPLSVAEMREQTLKAIAHAQKFFPCVSMRVEPISRGRIPLKATPRTKMTTHHKRAKPRDRRYLKNDARAHISGAKK
jgi:hypothetical protein